MYVQKYAPASLSRSKGQGLPELSSTETSRLPKAKIVYLSATRDARIYVLEQRCGQSDDLPFAPETN